MNKIKKGLTILGLTGVEAKVCLKLLKLKQAKVSELTRATKVSRTQLYPLLNKLVKKGFLRKIVDEPIIRYRVIGTEELIDLVEKKKRNQIKILKELESKLKKLKGKK